MLPAVAAGDIEQHAAGDHRRRMLDAEPLQPPVGHRVGGGQAVVQPVALGEMPERVDMRADMRGHLDALDIGAGVVGGAERAAALDRVTPRRPDRQQERRLVRRHERRTGADLVAHVVDAALAHRLQRGKPLLHRQQIAGADLVGRTPARMVVHVIVSSETESARVLRHRCHLPPAGRRVLCRYPRHVSVRRTAPIEAWIRSPAQDAKAARSVPPHRPGCSGPNSARNAQARPGSAMTLNPAGAKMLAAPARE